MCAILGFTSPSLKKEQVLPYFEKTKSRGPDDTRLEPAGSGMLGFHRLAIMGLHPEGMQPFHRGGDMAVCNGELYGFRPVKKALEAIPEVVDAEASHTAGTAVVTLQSPVDDAALKKAVEDKDYKVLGIE